VAQTSNLPAAAPQTRAPAPAPVIKQIGGEAPSAAPSSSGLKVLVWLLVVLNVAGAGAWGWFKLFKNREAERALNTTRARLLKLEQDMSNLNAMVREIDNKKVNEVSDPRTVITEVATFAQNLDSLDIGSVHESRFHKTNYTEKTVRITFLNRKVYTFAQLVGFLQYLEKANPTVQIKEVDFGKRTPPTIGSDSWVPQAATVRVLQLTGGS
jgi:hypothetical protein